MAFATFASAAGIDATVTKRSDGAHRLISNPVFRIDKPPVRRDR